MPNDQRPPTPRQRDLANAVKRLVEARGYAPSLAEIAEELEVCQNRARELVVGAAERGLVSYSPRVHRSIKPIEVRRQPPRK